jgi:hypothetical protein
MGDSAISRRFPLPTSISLRIRLAFVLVNSVGTRISSPKRDPEVTQESGIVAFVERACNPLYPAPFIFGACIWERRRDDDLPWGSLAHEGLHRKLPAFDSACLKPA